MKHTIKKLLALILALCLCAGFASFSRTSAAAAGLETDELFTARDMAQTADLSEAVTLTVTSGENLNITEAGVYVLSGTATEASVVVEAPDDAKVQLVLDALSISNSDFPCIYVKSADKVFVTLINDSSLSVTGSFRGDGEVNTDGAIFSRCDLVLNGSATLTVSSTANGIVSKDDLKITGGCYVISAASHALEGKDSVRIADGSFRLIAGKDAIHAENDEDDSLGTLYIAGGSFSIQAGDDGIHARSLLQIDGGSFSIRASEGIEATYVIINGGTIDIQASDDGINAARKSSAYSAAVEINGGDITISMGAGDTDGVDSNGTLTITGGTVSVTGSSCFDVDGTVQFTGGTVYVNGQQVSSIPVQMMGGGMGGERGGWGGMDPGSMGGMPGGMGPGMGGPRG